VPADTVLRLSDVSFAYRDSLPVLRDVCLELHSGWTALVGPNGAGKTTLLRLLAGELEPESGAIHVAPRAAARLLCRQTAEESTPQIRAFAAARDGAARRWQGALQLDPDALGRWPTLSPGERRRWQVGAALAAAPAVLMLDEPTDHLDADARELLIDALARYRGVGVLVSHDRALLARLAASTARLHEGGVELRRTGFEEAREAWRMENEARRSAREKVRREEKKLRRRLGQRRSDLQSAEAKTRTRNRAKGRKDRDQRTMAAKNRARAGAARMSRQVALLRDRTARVSADLDDLRFEKERTRSVFVGFEPAPVEHLATLRDATLRAGGRAILAGVSVELRRGTRAWLRGPNGSGKSTLLRALHAEIALPAERVLHLPQELPDEGVAELLHRVHRLGSEERGRFLAVAAALGAEPERLLETERPSPGEARKLWVADGLSRHVAVALLDEPTNHLDLPAVERLEAALASYPGALLLVTHDEPLARACTDETFDVGDGKVRPA
jgi:ATPase subunit of ABC transporter with duplicated ATPase domains